MARIPSAPVGVVAAPVAPAGVDISATEDAVSSPPILDEPVVRVQEAVPEAALAIEAPVRPSHPIIRAPVRPTPVEDDESEEVEAEIAAAPAIAPAAPPAVPASEPSSRAFGSLFGGFKAKSDRPAQASADTPASVSDDKFDNDLEIPAFLRRSSNT